MKKLRKVNMKRRKKEYKEAQAELQRRTAMFSDHPTECCVCQTEFKRTQKTVKSWHVTVNEERVRLTCPACWTTVTEVIKQCQE